MKDVLKKFLKNNIYPVIGFGIAYLTVSLSIFPGIDKIEIYNRENKPNVMRVFRPGRDGILMENPDESGIYDLSLRRYLRKTIEDKAERKIERINIKKLAGFYD